MPKKKSRRQPPRRFRGSGRRVPVNEFVDQAALEDVLRAIQRLPVDLDWALAAPNVVPLLPRRRPVPAPSGKPLAVLLPPGIMTGFGLDAGPAVMHIGEEALAGWGIEAAELVARALSNVRLRTERLSARDLHVDSIEGAAVRVLQTGEGCASALLLVPDELTRIFGSSPQRFVAPMRDVLVSMPAEADPATLAWLNDELANLDPNALALDAFRLENGDLRLEPLGLRAVPA